MSQFKIWRCQKHRSQEPPRDVRISSLAEPEQRLPSQTWRSFQPPDADQGPASSAAAGLPRAGPYTRPAGGRGGSRRGKPPRATIPAPYNRKGVPGNSFQWDFLHWHPQRGAGWGTGAAFPGGRRGSQEAVSCCRTSPELSWKEGRGFEETGKTAKEVQRFLPSPGKKMEEVAEICRLPTKRQQHSLPLNGALFASGWKQILTQIVQELKVSLQKG
ncbi:uncharacterized protein LOC128905111 [Rissa tridactyla]|uniref:uncharacterized protein LOC128905111 n=1 Tax=Rissa tridactyla TaxID=75485 RepID=UPI0023BAD6FA|nr:uncharacterized protein LOC128905111 [Rissa tridactyla]